MILIIAVADFVMIAELPLFVSSLQIEGNIHVPERELPDEDKAPGNLDSSAKDQMDRIGEIVDDSVYILYRSRRDNQGIER